MMSITGSYAYDAEGRLAHTLTPVLRGWTFWHGRAAVNELRSRAGVDEHVTWLRMQKGVVAELTGAGVPHATLLGAAPQGSILMQASAGVRVEAYAPQGHRAGEGTNGIERTSLAFNGEMLDSASGCYLLGPGHHRAYSPTLGLFLAPDPASPFGRGGLNTLAYCAGDPINRTDPTGHFWKWVVAAVTVVAAAAITLATGGTGLAVLTGAAALTKATAVATVSTTLGLVGTAVESAALIAHGTGNGKVGNILGWVGLGVAAVGTGIAAPALVKATKKVASTLWSKASRFVQRASSTRATSRGGLTAGSVARGESTRAPPVSAALPDPPASPVRDRAYWRRANREIDAEIRRVTALRRLESSGLFRDKSPAFSTSQHLLATTDAPRGRSLAINQHLWARQRVTQDFGNGFEGGFLYDPSPRYNYIMNTLPEYQESYFPPLVSG